MGQVRYTREAREDLLQIWVDIAPHDMRAADRVYDLIESRCDLLREHRELGPARPEVGAGARVLIVEKWIAFYRLVEDGVQIVRVVDGRRDLTKLEWNPEA